MVGGKDPHHGVVIHGMQNMRRQADGGGRVALRRFGQDLLRRNLGKLGHHGIAEVGVGEHPEALGGDHRRETVHGALDERAPAHDVQYLFGGAFPAPWPEPRAASSGQNHSVIAPVHFTG